MAMKRSIRAIVVDDSRIMRALIKNALEAEGDISVVAEAEDVQTARSLIKQHSPDVLTLDVEMPGMDGIEFLRRIMALRPMPVIMVSTTTEAGTDTALRALEIGALDAVPKPGGALGRDTFGAMLRDRARAAMVNERLEQNSHKVLPYPATPTRRVDLVAIGASTGGVAAIGTLLKALSPDGPPVVVVQHMPGHYIRRFAQRLDAALPLDVGEARHGEVVGPGQVRIAPGHAHLEVARSGRWETRLRESDPVCGYRPSVDVLFSSVARCEGSAMGVLLTGMGSDGAKGLLEMRTRGQVTLGQAADSCVVYGMPRAAQALGALDDQLPLQLIGERISTLSQLSAVKHGR